MQLGLKEFTCIDCHICSTVCVDINVLNEVEMCVDVISVVDDFTRIFVFLVITNNHQPLLCSYLIDP